MILALLLALGASAFAAPMPPHIVANHETQQCATIPGGDECFDCQPASEEWDVLGFADEAECPADYEFVEIDYVCAAFKEQFCCTQGHSGVDGDCEDMVINNWKDECAFVPDISSCTLPSSWKKPAGNETGPNWGCPTEYEWTSVECLSEEESRDGSLFGLCPCSGGLLTGLLLAVAAVLSIKQTEILPL